MRALSEKLLPIKLHKRALQIRYSKFKADKSCSPGNIAGGMHRAGQELSKARFNFRTLPGNYRSFQQTWFSTRRSRNHNLNTPSPKQRLCCSQTLAMQCFYALQIDIHGWQEEEAHTLMEGVTHDSVRGSSAVASTVCAGPVIPMKPPWFDEYARTLYYSLFPWF